VSAPRKDRSKWRSRARRSPRLRATLVRLGDRIRALRNDLGRTQEDVAERADLDAKHLQEIERGSVNATVATLLGIARALKVTLADLFLDV
jgi:transcriptional regulator with XRE-family HTH domain